MILYERAETAVQVAAATEYANAINIFNAEHPDGKVLPRIIIQPNGVATVENKDEIG